MAEETAAAQAAREERERLAQHAGKAHYYNPAKNPTGAYLAGVPNRDLSGDEWDGLSVQQRREALHHGFWRLSPVPHAAEDAPPEDEAPATIKRPASAARSVGVHTAPPVVFEGSSLDDSPAGPQVGLTPDAAPPNPVGADKAGN